MFILCYLELIVLQFFLDNEDFTSSTTWCIPSTQSACKPPIPNSKIFTYLDNKLFRAKFYYYFSQYAFPISKQWSSVPLETTAILEVGNTANDTNGREVKT